MALAISPSIPSQLASMKLSSGRSSSEIFVHSYSQPLLISPSRSIKPGRQSATQPPAMHSFDAPSSAPQLLPQAPQCAFELIRSVQSAPQQSVDAPPSQSSATAHSATHA